MEECMNPYSISIDTSSVNSLQSQINDHLVNILTFICKNPLIFNSESDVHELVMRELMNIPKLNPNETLFDTSCSIGKNIKGKQSKINYKTMLMHKEYGHATSAFSRSDIVILNPSDVKGIDDPINLRRDNKWLIPDYVFEFGTEKSAGSVSVLKKHIKNDIKKVANATKQGYLIHIHRNYYKSSGGRKLKNIEKFEKYSEAILDEINLINKNNNKLPKIIVIKINIGGKGRDIRKEGKVRILRDPYNNPNCKLTGINAKNICSELQSLIKQ